MALEVVRPLAGSVDAEQQKVVVAFLSPSLEGLGARAESVIDLSDLERWKEMIRTEARMWDLPVRLLSEDQWRMPQLDSKADLYNPEFSTEIMGSMAVALDGMGVAPPVVQEFLRGGINVLYPPVSGRVRDGRPSPRSRRRGSPAAGRPPSPRGSSLPPTPDSSYFHESPGAKQSP